MTNLKINEDTQENSLAKSYRAMAYPLLEGHSNIRGC